MTEETTDLPGTMIMRCSRCHSTDVRRDGIACWNPSRQQWELIDRLTLPEYRDPDAEHDTRDEGIGVIVWLFAAFFFAVGFCAGWVFTKLPW